MDWIDCIYAMRCDVVIRKTYGCAVILSIHLLTNAAFQRTTTTSDDKIDLYICCNPLESV